MKNTRMVAGLVMVICLGACQSDDSISGARFDEGLAGIVSAKSPKNPGPNANAYSHFLAGCIYERGGKTDLAIDEYKKAADIVSESPTITLHLVRAYIRLQDYESAQTMAERAVKLLPDNANILIVLGEIYHQRERYDDAVAAFQKAIEIDPANLMGYGGLLTVEESTNDLVAAIDVYQRLSTLMPGAAQVHFQLGLSLARINDNDGARAALERALAVNPELIQARFLLGAVYMELNEAGRAEEQLEKFLEHVPGDVRARENLVGALARQQKYVEALEQAKALVSAQEPQPQHQIGYMLLLLLANQYKEADLAVPTSGAPFLGTLLRAVARQGMGEPYLPLLESMDSVEGDLDQECDEILGGVLYLFGKEQTGDYFMRFIDGCRNQGVQTRAANLIEARMLLHLEQPDAAVTLLSDTLEKFGPEKWTHYYLAMAYEELKRIPETETHLKAYLKLEPNDAEALNFLGYLYAENGIQLDEAEALIKRALEIEPQNGFYLDSLGWVYYQKGKAELAIENIQKAIALSDSDDSELRNHLGDAYWLNGDKQKALDEWKRALRLNPKIEGVEEKIQKQQK